jgi:hypothetical protein
MDWIEWHGHHGAKPPVDGDELVQVLLVEGFGVLTRPAKDLYWWIPRTLPTGIKQYRIYKG